MKKITKDMPMTEVLLSVPKAQEILLRHGMGCVGCPFAMNVDKLVKEINDSMEKK